MTAASFGWAVAAWALAAEPEQRVLSLDEALASAEANQPQLRQAAANAEAAQARAGQARAPLLPQVRTSASYERSTGNASVRLGIPGATSTGRSGTFDFYRLNATASQLIYDFGQSWNRYQASRATAEGQAQTQEAVRLSARLNVRLAYFNARAQHSLVQVARETLENEDLRLRQIRAFVEVGVRPEIDLAQQRTTQANARVQFIQAENDYLTAKAQLNQAMGVEGPLDYQVAPVTLPPVAGEEGEIDALVSEALDRRPEYASRLKQVEAQARTVRSARGAYLPGLTASVGVSEAGTQPSNLNFTAYGQLGLSWSLFEGLLTFSQVKEAQASLRAAEADRDILRQQTRLELEQARLSVRAARASIGASEDAATNARERLRLAEGRYRAGAGNVIELGDAQVALTNAAAQQVQAEYNLATARAQLLQRLGRP